MVALPSYWLALPAENLVRVRLRKGRAPITQTLNGTERAFERAIRAKWLIAFRLYARRDERKMQERRGEDAQKTADEVR